MATTQDTKKKEEAVSIGEKMADFIQKNRKVLLIALIAIIVVLAGLIIVFTVRDRIQEKALSQVDGFNRRYMEARVVSDDPDAAVKMIETFALLEDLKGFTAKNSGYAAARAYSLTADIYWDQKNWSDAEEAWLNAAKAAGKSYLAPVSFYNAAVAAEERGDIEAAITHYNGALEHASVFPSAVRAQFSVGRLEESRNRKEAALEAYNNVLNNWPNDPTWPNLAQSRILALE